MAVGWLRVSCHIPGSRLAAVPLLQWATSWNLHGRACLDYRNSRGITVIAVNISYYLILPHTALCNSPYIFCIYRIYPYLPCKLSLSLTHMASSLPPATLMPIRPGYRISVSAYQCVHVSAYQPADLPNIDITAPANTNCRPVFIVGDVLL